MILSCVIWQSQNLHYFSFPPNELHFHVFREILHISLCSINHHFMAAGSMADATAVAQLPTDKPLRFTLYSEWLYQNHSVCVINTSHLCSFNKEVKNEFCEERVYRFCTSGEINVALCWYWLDPKVGEAGFLIENETYTYWNRNYNYYN